MTRYPLARWAFCVWALAPAAAAFAGPAPTSSLSKDIEAKLALEASLEKRLQDVLRKVLATEDLLVIVNVEPLSETEKRELEVLPGVPVKDTPSNPAPLGVPLTLVRRMSATVLVDTTASEADVQLAKKTSEGILGIDPSRGDTLSIDKMTLRRAHSAVTPSKLLEPAFLLSLAWLLLAAGLGVLLHRKFLEPFQVVMRDAAAGLENAAKERQERAERRDAPAEAATAAEPAAVAASPQPAALEAPKSQLLARREELPFSFLEERDLPVLQLLIRGEPQVAAVVIHYLPPELASRALGSLDAPAREQVIGFMSRVTLLDQAEVRQVEDSIRSQIDFMMGGEEKLAAILDHAPSSLQEDVLATVRSKDPNLGARLARRVVLLDDIALLEEADLKLLSRQVPVRSLAAVLKRSDALRTQVLPKLSTGIGQWLTQEIELFGDMPPHLIEQEQRRVLTTLSNLIREGRITLRKDALPPVLEGPAAAPAA